ncbi:thioredoxin family protein [Flavobacterium sp. ARAG 55.4]|uniref:thioredoxin family protein n=1 Tax=Flavobacterium sp. ARAG 55.4 TaxID=3451357 RepID=UPI003F458BEB
MKKRLFILLIFFWAIPSGFAQLKTHTFEEAEQLAVKNPKPFVVFTHTSWCKYCKLMENSTFKNPEIISILNDSFYFVALDAEDKKDITFNKHTFQYKPTGTNTGIHELATALATSNNQVTYPTLTILDPDYSILFQQASYLKALDLLEILEKIK